MLPLRIISFIFKQIHVKMKNPIQEGGGGGGGGEIPLVASCYRNRDKLRRDRPQGSNTDFTLPQPAVFDGEVTK